MQVSLLVIGSGSGHWTSSHWTLAQALFIDFLLYGLVLLMPSL